MQRPQPRGFEWGGGVGRERFPNATVAILFAQQYRTAQAETASIMLVATLGMIVSIPLMTVAAVYL